MRTIAAEILCLCETKRNSIIVKDYLAIITYSCAPVSTILIALLLRHKFSIEHSSIAFDEFECVVCCVETVVVSTKTKSRLISVCFNHIWVHSLCRNGRRSFMVPSMTMISSECANSQCQMAFDWFNWRFRCVRTLTETEYGIRHKPNWICLPIGNDWWGVRTHTVVRTERVRALGHANTDWRFR